nr:hypothetical protein [Tanacetum cinerariifolium]
MMKQYNSSRSGKALEAVVKVLVAGERNICKELDDERFRTKARFKASGRFGTSGSFVDRLSIFVTDLVTSEKAKVIKWLFKGVKAFSHANLDEYIRVALLGGLLIARRKNLTGKDRQAEEMDYLLEELCSGSLGRLRRGSLGASLSKHGVVSMYLLKD